MFASASPDNIKQWTCPDGKFVQNLTGHNAIVNCMAVNSDGVLMSGANNGSIYAWDWRTGYNFQRMQVSYCLNGLLLFFFSRVNRTMFTFLFLV